MAYLPLSISGMLPEEVLHVHLFCALLSILAMREVLSKKYVMK
jgi:hypothetical protein